MTWCWLTLLLTGITPLNVWADSDIYNKPIEQTQDVSQVRTCLSYIIPGLILLTILRIWGHYFVSLRAIPAMVHVLRAVTGLLGITLLIQSG